MHAGIPPPRPGTPPRTRHPPPPGPGTHPLGAGTHPPGAGTPPGTEHARRYGQRAGGMHPTGMQSCSFHFFILQTSLPKNKTTALFDEILYL